MTDELIRYKKRQKEQKQFIATTEYTQLLLNKITELEKEKTELKKTNDKLIEEIQMGMIYRGLQYEIEELKKQIENYKISENESVEIIADLKEQISVLLSCSNCSENKGGYICDKEYNDKCLAQKIEYIKELKVQIEKMKNDYKKQRNRRIDELQKENAKLKKYCDCEYYHKNNSGDEFTVKGTNKTLCEYCLENNKKFFEL